MPKAKSKRVKRTAPNMPVHSMGRGPLAGLWAFVVWIVGVLVSLAVGSGMIGDGVTPVLSIRYIPDIVTVTAGWIVVVLTVLGVVLGLISKLSR